MASSVLDPLAERLRRRIRDIPDFPQAGILFKDITPVLTDAELFAAVIRRLANDFREIGIDQVVGIEARGFIFAAPLALHLGAGFIPVRKPGKLPHRTRRVDYDLEYGTDAVEAHDDAIRAGQRVLIVDDVLATGGTAGAAAQLIEQLGGDVVGIAVVIELAFLGGRKKLGDLPFHTLVRYETAG